MTHTHGATISAPLATRKAKERPNATEYSRWLMAREPWEAGYPWPKINVVRFSPTAGESRAVGIFTAADMGRRVHNQVTVAYGLDALTQGSYGAISSCKSPPCSAWSKQFAELKSLFKTRHCSRVFQSTGIFFRLNISHLLVNER